MYAAFDRIFSQASQTHLSRNQRPLCGCGTKLLLVIYASALPNWKPIRTLLIVVMQYNYQAIKTGTDLYNVMSSSAKRVSVVPANNQKCIVTIFPSDTMLLCNQNKNGNQIFFRSFTFLLPHIRTFWVDVQRQKIVEVRNQQKKRYTKHKYHTTQRQMMCMRNCANNEWTKALSYLLRYHPFIFIFVPEWAICREKKIEVIHTWLIYFVVVFFFSL